MNAVSPPLWARQGPYYWDGPGGTRVSAARVVAEWRYSAWGPEDRPELSYWQWLEAVQAEIDVQGAEKAQELPRRRAWLGVFPTAEEARVACLAWLHGQDGADG